MLSQEHQVIICYYGAWSFSYTLSSLQIILQHFKERKRDASLHICFKWYQVDRYWWPLKSFAHLNNKLLIVLLELTIPENTTAQTNLILPDYQKLVRALGKASTSMNSSSLRKLGEKMKLYRAHYHLHISAITNSIFLIRQLKKPVTRNCSFSNKQWDYLWRRKLNSSSHISMANWHTSRIYAFQQNLKTGQHTVNISAASLPMPSG